jgi:hypothetical protein
MHERVRKSILEVEMGLVMVPLTLSLGDLAEVHKAHLRVGAGGHGGRNGGISLCLGNLRVPRVIGEEGGQSNAVHQLQDRRDGAGC